MTDSKKAYYERNKAEILAKQKIYYKANSERFAKRQANRRVNHKVKAIEYLGGSCQKCGGVFHPSVYDFHHRDPTEKEYNPASLMSGSWEKIQPELDKCDLLCSNCHRELHHNLLEMNDV